MLSLEGHSFLEAYRHWSNLVLMQWGHSSWNHMVCFCILFCRSLPPENKKSMLLLGIQFILSLGSKRAYTFLLSEACWEGASSYLYFKVIRSIPLKQFFPRAQLTWFFPLHRTAFNHFEVAVIISIWPLLGLDAQRLWAVPQYSLPTHVKHRMRDS